MNRRDFIKSSAAMGVLGLSPIGSLASPPAASPAASPAGPRFVGEAVPFDYAWLKGRARTLSAAAYQAPVNVLPAAIKSFDWDQYQSIQYRNDHALWARDRLQFQSKFFHLGLFFQQAVHMHEVADGQARELAYDPAMFSYGKSGVDGTTLPADLGFAGFRLNFHSDFQRDVAAFLGASYFRAVGSDLQYGLSARGLAVDCGLNRAEEFPRFTSFWLERPDPRSSKVTVYALMDSPSVTGAYRFDVYPGATLVMDIDAALYPRTSIERLGIAPLTSMFQCGANDKRMANDWRPQIHDSDGLAMWTGSGEWIWRPLTNPAGLRFNAHLDENPRGFGLLQRDRNFDHYQDDGVFYDRRPSLWVEPKSGWGKGSIQLVEIPTNDETFDNIVAFWNPERPTQAGDELLLGYRLHWGNKMPVTPPLATVEQTRTGIGGIVGRKRTYFSWRFAVDFVGGTLPMFTADSGVEAVVSASRGEIELVSARPLASIKGYRAMFDLKVTDAAPGPINLRLFLRSNEQPLSETWLYQWTPPADRSFV
ncbi:glucan biosynthesis protein [Rariglobus hedericola]|uniref:Glucan biosynthesis protein D n=1 Tax=Rariglobus hedericola TaxID=2597822 RepID=A0A556QK81_9BACT|nr:glucan biosynthesis protein D [Rariglobus hedericola]TSJ77027.1 glucan biosynthesis protein D [Rariglobus hedericola]